MNIGIVLQYVTLISLLAAGLAAPVAFFIHRQQAKTQIFLALSERYDDLLETCPTRFWLSGLTGVGIPERNEDLSMSVIRFCTLVSLAYFLFREHQIPERMWHLMLRSVEHRMRSPFFVREWEQVKSEFEPIPDFVELVTSIQQRAR